MLLREKSYLSSMEAGYPTSAPELFATDIERNIVELKDVILNEFHVLRKFCLISLSDDALRVSLESDLPSQIGFQLNNENIDNADEICGTAPVVATFLANDFSEVFNTVNLVSEVILQPRQVQQVILTFRPSQPSNEHDESAREFKEGQQDAESISDQKLHQNGSVEYPFKKVYPRTNQTFPVNGMLFLSATVVKQDMQSHSDIVIDTGSDCRQDIVILFQSTVCQTILKADVPDILFDDCIPGGVFVKDFSIWNLSEIPCAFQLHIKNLQSELLALDLTDYDTGLSVNFGEIKGCAHRRIRVTYKPRDVGDFKYSIILENSFDAANSTVLPVQCMVNTEHRQEGLLVTGVGDYGVLDFGDCYSKNGTCQLLSLRNITQEALIVNLGTDHAPDDKVNFYLQMEQEIPSKASSLVPSKLSHGEQKAENDQTATIYGQKLSGTLGSNLNLDKKNRIEELSLDRGEEKSLLVWYYPAGALDEAKAARLQRRTFRLSLKCVEKKGHSKQRFSNIIQCKACVCTSIVKLSTAELNFGDCNIGSYKTATVELINLSELPALVTSYVTSTVLRFRSKAEQVSIPPRQAYSLDIDLVPLKVNPKYRKQVTVDNLYNSENQQLLDVRAKIMDHHHVLLHSRYYKLHTPSTNNFLNFDCVVVNNPSVRTLAVENITDKYLTLAFTTSMPGELGIYQLRDEIQSEMGEDTCSLSSEGTEEDCHETRRRAYAASVNKEKLLETLEESQRPLSKAIVDSAPFPVKQDLKKSIPPRPPFSASERKTRMRMSLDLATSAFSNNGTDKVLGMETSVAGAIPGRSDLKTDTDGISNLFNSTEHVPRPLKRVQSSALLSAMDEAQNLVPESSQEEVSHYCIEEVLTRLGNLTVSHCSFPDEETEKKYVDNLVKDRDVLIHVLEDLSRTLTSVRKLELPPGETKALYVLLTVDGQSRLSVQGRLQMLTAKVNIQLLEYDKEQQELLEPGFLELASDGDLHTREMPVQFKVCRAVLALAQKNINFGKLFTNEHRAKTLVLNNVSDVPLVYKLKKTGSIASGDLHIINGRTGILRSHSDREVNFVFQPSLGGVFHETLVVGNVYDPSNDQVVTLKATISRADTFWLNTASIDFGALNIGKWCRPQSVVIVNNSKQSRTFMMKATEGVNDERITGLQYDTTMGISIAVMFMLEEKKNTSQRQALPEEELIETLERKGLGYERKGKANKAAKVRKQIDELRAKVALEMPCEKDLEGAYSSNLKIDQKEGTSSEPSTKNKGLSALITDADKHLRKIPSTSVLKGSNGFIGFTLKGGDSQIILVSIMATSSVAVPQGHRIKGAFIAFESKNKDVVKKVCFEATAFQRFSKEVVPGALGSESLNVDLCNVSADVACAPVIAQSPSFSPESSAPTSPSVACISHSTGAQDSFRPSSLDINSSLSPFEGFASSFHEAPGSPAVHSLAADFLHVLETDAWGSEQHILQWGQEPLTPIESGFDARGIDDDSSYGASPPESCSSLPTFKPVFKIDLLHELESKSTANVETKKIEFDGAMDLSSAAALARSLAFDGIQQPGKPIFVGEITLEDIPYQEKVEGSFMLRSLCDKDVSIHFHLAWDGDPEVIELWVSDFQDNLERGANEGGILTSRGQILTDASTTDPSGITHQCRQVHWQQHELAKFTDTDNTIFLSSVSLEGGTSKLVKLICPDLLCQQLQLSSHPTIPFESATANVGINWRTEDRPPMGVLTMQTQPDDGLLQQLLVRIKQPERLVTVVPMHVDFPDSDLTTVLTQDLKIKNRSYFEVSYLVKICGATSSISTAIYPVKKEQSLDNVQTLPESLGGFITESQDWNLLSSSDTVVQVTPAFGRIEACGAVSITVTCRPVKPGKQSYRLQIQSSACLRETEVGITLMPYRAQYLNLPDLENGGTLDMGFCYINAPCGEKVVPVRLQNVSQELLSLTFRSNLAKQVYISGNPDGSLRIDELQIPKDVTSTIYMCLRPGGDATVFEGGQCREIIGGMRITARAILATHVSKIGEDEGVSQGVILDEIMVKFRAVVGRSLLQVSTTMIDLGRVKEVGGFVSGYFSVCNPSSQMQLHFSLKSKKAILSAAEGYLVGKEAAKTSGDIGKSELVVRFCLPVHEYGLIEDKIVLQNLSCAGQNAAVVLRLFVDNGMLEAQAESPLPHFQVEGIDNPQSHTDWFANRREFSDKYIHPFNLIAEVAKTPSVVETSVQTMRRVSSTGDFSSSNLATSLVRADAGTREQQESFCSFVTKNISHLTVNSYLDLGTICVSSNQSSKTVNLPGVESHEDFLYSISDLRPYFAAFSITNYSEETVELQPFSTLSLHINQDKYFFASEKEPMPGESAAQLQRSDRGSNGSHHLHSPLQDLNVSVGKEYAQGNISTQNCTDLVTNLSPCGAAFVLEPHCSTRLFVTCLETKMLSLSEVTRLHGGKLSPMEGLLVFFNGGLQGAAWEVGNMQSAQCQAAETMNIRSSLCVSVGKLAKDYVDLGKIGHANRWADVELEFALENCSDVALIYRLGDVPECFKILADTSKLKANSRVSVGCVPPRGSKNIQIILCTSKLENVQEVGLCSWRIQLFNCNNPINLMEMVVEAEMTVQTLRFGGLTESALILPPLTVPVLPTSSPCITHFVVENLSLESLGVALQLHQTEETESLVMLELCSQTGTTIGELTLGAGEKVELRVSARAISDLIPPHCLVHPCPQTSIQAGENVNDDNERMGSSVLCRGAPTVAGNNRVLPVDRADHEISAEVSSQLVNTVCMGQLYLFSSPHLPDCIAIYGTFIQGPTFDVSPHTLHLQAKIVEDDAEVCSSFSPSWEGRHDMVGSSQILVVRNFRAFEVLQFKASVGHTDEIYSEKFPSSIVSVQPPNGLIPPHGSAELLVKVQLWSSSELQSFYEFLARIELECDHIEIPLCIYDTEDQNIDQSMQFITVKVYPPEQRADAELKAAQAKCDIVSRTVQFEESVSKESSRTTNGFKRGLPVLGLRGCTPVSGSPLCYEFNLGQQNISSGGRLHWDLTLVGDQHLAISYLLSTISESDASWLSMSSSYGLVESGQQKIVQLSFSTKSMGVYSTYLVVENCENPADLKTVHLSMEVVAPRNARPEAPSLSFFHVLVQGDRAEGTVIDMGEVYYNFWYRNRSFVVVNEAPVAMEFLLSSSMDRNDSTELNFSLANTSLKRFSSVTLGSKSSLRIWIHFCPGPSKDKSIIEDTCDEMSASIFVNCRLVKDYQLCIPFQAKCRYPQIGISTTDIVFSTCRQGQMSAFRWGQEDLGAVNVESSFHGGPVNAPLIESVSVVGSTGTQQQTSTTAGLAFYTEPGKQSLSLPPDAAKLLMVPPATLSNSRRDDDIDLIPPLQFLVIKNLYLHRELQYIVKNDSLFFTTDIPHPPIIQRGTTDSGCSTLEKQSRKGSNQTSHTILVRPNMESLHTYQKMILKQKYIEEHLTVYNRHNPREKYAVSLRITAGHLRNFFAAPGRKNSYPFSRLELSITCFLSAFYSLTSKMLTGVIPGNFQTTSLMDSKNGKLKRKEGGLGLGTAVKQEMSSLEARSNFRALEKCLESFCASEQFSAKYDSLYFDFHYLTDELVFYCLKERWSRGGATLELATVQLSKLLYCALYRCQIFQLCLNSCHYFSSLHPTATFSAPDTNSYEYTELELKSYISLGKIYVREGSICMQGVHTEETREKVPPFSPRHTLKFVEDWTGQLRHFLSFFPDSRDDLIPLRELNQRIQDGISSCRTTLDCVLN